VTSATESDPVLVAVSGVPGVGKSTVAELVAERVGAWRLRSDEIRKELFDQPTYTDHETRTVYETLCDRARTRLSGGRSVVLDATFADREHRQAVAELGTVEGVTVRLVRVVCEQSVLEERITRREGISDADLSVSREIRATFDPVERVHHRIDNSGSIADTHRQVRELF
jgi:Predicted kinase